MGGKSIYIKQIAILQVMAQVRNKRPLKRNLILTLPIYIKNQDTIVLVVLQLGCFLPATNAVLRICDRIFSRIGFNDSVELNASTFVYEVDKVSF